MIILESLKALQGYDTITIGHDAPVQRSAIDSTITYVKGAKEIHAASADAKTYSENLKAAGRLGRFLCKASLRRAPLNGASVDDWSQGVPLGRMHELVDYWLNRYD